MNWDIALRAAAIAILLLLAGLVLRERRADWRGRSGALLLAAIASHLACPWASAGGLAWVLAPVYAGCLGVPAFLWLFTDSVFAERFRPRWWHAAGGGALMLAGLAQWLVSGATAKSAWSAAYGILSVVIVGTALLRSWHAGREDLVRARRRFRAVLHMVVAGYAATVVMVEFHFRGSVAPAALSAAHAAVVLVLAVAGTAAFTGLRAGRFWPAESLTPPGRADAEEALQLARLAEAIEERKVHRTEGLTLGMLAEQLGMPEHRLRHLVNARLGHRNFSDFLNRHRVADACAALRDPARRGQSVLDLALELGYGSTGPFNRAFKAITGRTPSQYRSGEIAPASGPADS